VIQNSIKSWGLLALCAVLDALFSAMIFFVQSPDGSPALRALIHPRDSIEQMGALALAAGACTIIAALWSAGKGNSWLLALNGLACGALGLYVMLGATKPVAFRTIPVLIVVMAVSMCLYEIAAARARRGHRADEWLLGTAGIISLGFAGAFLAFVFRLFPLVPSPSAQTFHWLASYLAFSAICMLGLAFMPQPGSRRVPTGGAPAC
jgi:uncharacterized membrane protein HdeD (DUF308 family)